MQRELSAAALGLWAVFAAAVAPADALTVSQWAERERVVAAESGSPYAGRWSNDRVPYLVEPMDCCGLDHPASEVVIFGSAQTGKSEVGVNAFGAMVCQEPSPALFVLPSLDEVNKYNSLKIGPTVEETPALRARIREVTSRDDQGSTTRFKRFRGGFAVLTTASSSKGLQMISARMGIYEEIVEYPEDVDGRGSPIDQAENRGKAWTMRGRKSIYISTAGTAKSDAGCAITIRYESSDKRRWYVPCPHCGMLQTLRFEQMRWDDDEAPRVAWLVCAAHGCVIDSTSKPAMIAAGRWLKTFDGGTDDPAPGEVVDPQELPRWLGRSSGSRQPGFHMWQAMSPFVPWEHTAREYRKAVATGPIALRTFSQQALGIAYREKGEAPDAQRLFDRREHWPIGRIPPGVLFLVGATDVQGNRLEWALWGFDRALSPHLVDRGVILGDPSDDAVWGEHDALLGRSWQDAWGKPWQAVRWGVDSGYLSSRVYTFARRHAASGKVMALDGRHGRMLPAIGAGKAIRFSAAGGAKLSVMLWPVGTHDLKVDIYSRLRSTIEGPGADGVRPAGSVRLPDFVDLSFTKQLTAEYLLERRDRFGILSKEWVKTAGQPNEALDQLVYALALAHHESDRLTDEQWRALAAERLGPPEAVQTDMAELWSDGIRERALAARMQPMPMNARPAAHRRVRSAGVI